MLRCWIFVSILLRKSKFQAWNWYEWMLNKGTDFNKCLNFPTRRMLVFVSDKTFGWTTILAWFMNLTKREKEKILCQKLTAKTSMKLQMVDSMFIRSIECITPRSPLKYQVLPAMFNSHLHLTNHCLPPYKYILPKYGESHTSQSYCGNSRIFGKSISRITFSYYYEKLSGPFLWIGLTCSKLHHHYHMKTYF